VNIPDPPKFTDKDIEDCRNNNDFCPIIFEWYKYIGIVTNIFACISIESPAFKNIKPLHYSILIGLLNRCSRLILSNISLSHTGYYGDTVSILNRCIYESAIKLMWLCYSKDEDKFNIFISDGLRTEIELKNKINDNISKRSNDIKIIEKRMLDSIEKTIKISGLTESQARSTKKLPDLATMIDMIYGDRLLYITGQKIGSHFIHGTFVNLLQYYLVEENGIYVPRDHNCKIKPEHFIFTSRFVLEAIIAFCNYICEDLTEAETMCMLPNGILDEILIIYKEVVRDDFNIINE
jgi:hypothetical protein